ncbi:Uncharacterised protein [Mycobacteroides abscessus subsp. abscessus]|nr:Uncharacterised protein [Mycobacteroides abscessus subsp. abscessus]
MDTTIRRPSGSQPNPPSTIGTSVFAPRPVASITTVALPSASSVLRVPVYMSENQNVPSCQRGHSGQE